MGQIQVLECQHSFPYWEETAASAPVIPLRHGKDFHCLEGGNKAVQQVWPPAASPGFRFPDTPVPAQFFYNSQHQDSAQERHPNRLKVTCGSDGTAKPEMKSLRAGNTVSIFEHHNLLVMKPLEVPHKKQFFTSFVSDESWIVFHTSGKRCISVSGETIIP